MRPHLPLRLARPLALGLAGLALAPTPTSAADPPARYSIDEEQYLASHGTGAPTLPVGLVNPPRREQSTVPGFDWTSATIGAGGATCILALGSLAAIAVNRRRRVPTAY
jgi:hypothetical protein